ncbi:ParA family protein [Candidatus Falkowbacteria bacterium]|nr:ParA family protein [Candidatus Falkowbacteria bacterium]MBT4433172.1 ParA family protein [Candidatus Falkowbacteria bacterium]
MNMIIAVVNQKGGVGKTTTAVNLSAYLAALGKFVLLVDLDPQANATSGFGIENYEKSTYEALMNKADIKDIVLDSFIPTHKIMPSSPDLAGATVELVNEDNREFVLSNVLLELKNSFDYIIIDCPPSLDLLTLNGLVAADQVLIPVQAEYYALEGLGSLLNTINLVQENLKPELGILGSVITMYDKRNSLSREVMNEMYKNFPFKIFRSVIPRNVRLTEAPSYGQAILQYDPRSKGARAYERLAKEVLDHINI